MLPAGTLTLGQLALYLPRPDSGMLVEEFIGSLLVMGIDPAIGVAVTATGLNCTTICSDWPAPIVADPPPLTRLYCDPALIKAIARGRAWFEELVSGRARSLQELAKRDGI
jgi:hypothetical protein